MNRFIVILTVFFVFSGSVYGTEKEILKSLLEAEITQQKVQSAFSYVGGVIVGLNGLGLVFQGLGAKSDNLSIIGTGIGYIVITGVLFWAGTMFGRSANNIEKDLTL